MSKRWSGATATVVASLVLLACGGIMAESDGSEAIGSHQQSTKAGFYYPCGDGSCDGNEPVTCPSDCEGTACGDQYCAPYENPSNCPLDCWPGAYCGNAVCDAGENHGNCPTDCLPPGPHCGDGLCEAGENSSNCYGDCGSCFATSPRPPPTPQGNDFYYHCGDGSCDGNEAVTCPSDCC